jgi:hypothetical protein
MISPQRTPVDKKKFDGDVVVLVRGHDQVKIQVRKASALSTRSSARSTERTPAEAVVPCGWSVTVRRAGSTQSRGVIVPGSQSWRRTP